MTKTADIIIPGLWTKQIPSKFNDAIGREFYAALRKTNTERELEHVKSGKLSAGRLGKPLLEQMLYVLGVPEKPVDDYALGLFRRGNDVEDTAIELLNPDAVQVEVFYRDVICIVDAVRNNMPYEVKSIKNSAFPYRDPSNTKRVRRDGKLIPQYEGVSYSHGLQAVVGALGLKSKFSSVLYASADDLRVLTHVIRVSDMQPEVDAIIDAFTSQMALKMLPKWVAREKWNADYSGYIDWINLEPEMAMKKLETEYPAAHAKLVGSNE